MCKRTESCDQAIAGQGHQGFSAFGNAASDFLNPPLLDAGIPMEVGFDPAGARWATVALQWLDAGILKDDDTGSPADLVRTAVTRWVEQTTPKLVSLGSAKVVVADSCPELWDESERAAQAEDGWFFGIDMDEHGPQFVMEERLTRLETICPGLGKSAWAAFHAASCCVVPIADPISARWLASYHWWFGEEDQDTVIEMREMEGYDGEDDAPPLPNEWDAAFPEWVIHPTEELGRDQLEELATTGQTEEIKAIARLILSIKEVEGAKMPELFGDNPVQEDYVYHLAHLRWNEADPIIRIIDDRAEEANQGGDGWSSFLGADRVQFDDASFFKWKTATEAGFRLLGLMEQLLPFIADPIQE